MKFFKKIILLLAVSATVASCSKDDDVESVSGNKYETTYAKITATYEGAVQTIEFNSAAELMENDIYLKVDFKSDNTFWIYEEFEGTSEWLLAGTWSQKDSKITINLEDQVLTATVDGSKLVMIMDLEDNLGKTVEVNVESSTSIEWHFSKT